MPTMEDYARQPREQRMQRLTRAADELAALVKGESDAVLSRRPDAKNWAARRSCAACATPKKSSWRASSRSSRWTSIRYTATPTPIAWPRSERQYLRNAVDEALAAFRRRRAETLQTFGELAPAQREKGGIHPVRGRITIESYLTIMAWHDDNHLDQLTRALRGEA